LKPRITVLTLGVDDLEASLRFYRDGLGLATEGIVGEELEYGAVAFFDLLPGLRLALWPRASIGHNVNSREEVDAVMAEAGRAGARIVKPAQDTFWGGYAGYFQDPDGHLWEVVWNPDLRVAE
jgi:catechol 2,3-dioxygenase-like lactoylglutathione lyase family enzyme